MLLIRKKNLSYLIPKTTLHNVNYVSYGEAEI